MRAYKTISWIRDFDWMENVYHKKENELLKSLWFEYRLWFYKKIVWDYVIWIDSKNWWYIDYQHRYSLQRIAPQTIEVKKHKEIWEIIKLLKPIIQ